MHPVLSSAVKLLFPQENVCHLCGRWAYAGILCEECLHALAAQTFSPERQTMRRNASPQRVISCWPHQSVARNLVHQLKYRADPSSAVFLADGMVCALRNEGNVLQEADILVPVPLHPVREKERGYNQAVLLSRCISRQTVIRLAEDVLFRTRPTGQLARMDGTERMRALSGVFAVSNPALIAGKRVLLADDVFTTGATAQACALALLQAGAKEVSAVTACRA